MAAQREWYEKDYYKVLGVSDDATPKDITKAYRKLARDSHPDTHPGDDAAEERFKEVSAAYDVLGDEAKRKEYDEVRRLGPIGGFQGGGPGGPGGYNFNVGSDGLGDILGQMFGRGRRGGGPSAAAGPQRGADVEATLNLDFADAAQGPHHHPVPHQRRAVQHLPRQRREARHATEGVLELRRAWRHRRQPGLVLVLVAVPRLRWARCRHHRSLPDVPRHRHRTPPARGAGADPGRRRRRAEDPPQGPRCAGSQRRPCRRPDRRVPRRARTACSAATATTSPSRCRSRSPRRRSAATSTCRRSTGRGSCCGSDRARRPARGTASRARAS